MAYYHTWHTFIVRESQNGNVDIPEEASAEECKQIRMQAGLRVIDVVIHPDKAVAHFDRESRCSFKRGSKLWLSRTDPETDCFNKALEIQAVVNNEIRFIAGTVFPADASEGRWRLDVAHDDATARSQLRHLTSFVQKAGTPLHSLVVEDLVLLPDSVRQLQVPPGPPTNRDVLDRAAARHMLNRRQTQALIQVFEHRCSLIQGPPGTGKLKET
jgi:hypothetical protein